MNVENYFYIRKDNFKLNHFLKNFLKNLIKNIIILIIKNFNTNKKIYN